MYWETVFGGMWEKNASTNAYRRPFSTSGGTDCNDRNILHQAESKAENRRRHLESSQTERQSRSTHKTS